MAAAKPKAPAKRTYAKKGTPMRTAAKKSTTKRAAPKRSTPRRARTTAGRSVRRTNTKAVPERGHSFIVRLMCLLAGVLCALLVRMYIACPVLVETDVADLCKGDVVLVIRLGAPEQDDIVWTKDHGLKPAREAVGAVQGRVTAILWPVWRAGAR